MRNTLCKVRCYICTSSPVTRLLLVFPPAQPPENQACFRFEKNILSITSIKGKRQFFRHIISYVFLYNEIKTYCLVSDKTTFLSLSVSKLDILAEKNPTYLSVSVFFFKTACVIESGYQTYNRCIK